MKHLRDIFFHSPWLYRAMRFLLGGVFVFAGAAKLVDPRAFARTISGYDLLPEELLVPVAIALPAIEFLAGVGLCFNIRGSLKVVSGLLAMFLGVLGYAILQNLDVDCGCFSAEEIRAQNNLQVAFVRDIGLMAVACYLFSWRWFHQRHPARIMD